MIAPDLRTGIDMLGDMIAEARTIVPFTGAGISTECGNDQSIFYNPR